MSTHDGAINYPVFHIWVVGKMPQHPLPNTLVAPPGKPFVNRVPLTVFRRQQAPLCPAATYPEHGLHKTATISFVCAHIGIRVSLQEVPNFVPLLILQSHVCHDTILLICVKCQQNLVENSVPYGDFRLVHDQNLIKSLRC
jgi:hypothetical protein